MWATGYAGENVIVINSEKSEMADISVGTDPNDNSLKSYVYPLIQRGSIVSRPDGRPQIHLIGEIVPTDLYEDARLFVLTAPSFIKICFRHYEAISGRDEIIEIANIEDPVQWWVYIIECLRFIDVVIWSDKGDPNNIGRDDIQNFIGCVRPGISF